MNSQKIIVVNRLPENLKPPAKKRKSWARSLKTVTTFEIHQTAVAGGFGATEQQIISAFKRDVEQADGFEPLTMKDVEDAFLRGVQCAFPPETPWLDPRAVGVVGRFETQSYHAVYLPRYNISLYQWHPKWWTYHGNGGNRYSIGWAYDGQLIKSHEDELDVDGAIASLCSSITITRNILEAAGLDPMQLCCFEAHAQHSAMRAGDPGKKIWQEIVIPAAEIMGMYFRPTRTTGSGKPITDWM